MITGIHPDEGEGLSADRGAYFRAYQRERRERLRALRDAQLRVCAATDCDRSLAGKRRGTRFCSNPCWQRERYRMRKTEQALLQTR